MGGVYEKYKLFVMVFMGMCIRVMGVLTTYVYVFFTVYSIHYFIFNTFQYYTIISLPLQQ